MYEGFVANGKFNHLGVYMSKHGWTYKGQFVNNCMEVTHTGILTQGDYTYDGSFEDNKRTHGEETFNINGKRIKRLATFYDS